MLNMLIKYGGFLIGKYMDTVLPQCNAQRNSRSLSQQEEIQIKFG